MSKHKLRIVISGRMKALLAQRARAQHCTRLKHGVVRVLHPQVLGCEVVVMVVVHDVVIIVSVVRQVQVFVRPPQQSARRLPVLYAIVSPVQRLMAG
jgi:hypothetical protein